MAKPPPPPPPSAAVRKKGPPPPPVPKGTRDRMELAAEAMRLRDEQLRASVVYVDPDLETNAELDAITAKVIDELKALQQAGVQAKMPSDPKSLEIELIKSLRQLLEKMISAQREHFLRHKIERIHRRIANLYFASELYTAPEDIFAIEYRHPDDALLAVMNRHVPTVVGDLEKLKCSEPVVRSTAIAQLQRFHRKLTGDVLARSRPELEMLLRVYRESLLVFLMKDFRSALGELAWEVVHKSRLARGDALSYKIREAQFSAFREAFESSFMERLLQSLQGPLQQRMHDEPAYDFRPETVRFAADPRIYAEICGVMCNTIYEFLHGEGFLDLPVSWQKQLYDL